MRVKRQMRERIEAGPVLDWQAVFDVVPELLPQPVGEHVPWEESPVQEQRLAGVGLQEHQEPGQVGLVQAWA